MEELWWFYKLKNSNMWTYKPNVQCQWFYRLVIAMHQNQWQMVHSTKRSQHLSTQTQDHVAVVPITTNILKEEPECLSCVFWCHQKPYLTVPCKLQLLTPVPNTITWTFPLSIPLITTWMTSALAISTKNINEIAKKNSGKNHLEGTVVSVSATPKTTTKGTECGHNLN